MEILHWAERSRRARRRGDRPAAADRRGRPDAHRCIVTDAWAPQVNGVVRTLSRCAPSSRRGPRGRGRSRPTSSARCRARPIPRSASRWPAAAAVGGGSSGFAPDAIHIATEGPLGLAARALVHARAAGRSPPPITPSFPTMWRGAPGCPRALVLALHPLVPRPRRRAIMVVDRHGRARSWTRTGSRRLRHWGRGVDLASFRPDAPPHPDVRRARSGRSSSTSAASRSRRTSRRSSQCRHPGTKVVVGDGPALAELKARYPDAHFLGPLHGDALAAAYAGGRRVRLSQPHRHVRAGDDRGAGLRHAGRRLTRCRARSTC